MSAEAEEGPRAPSGRRFAIALSVIVAVAVAIRVIYTLRSAPWPPTGLGDQVYYLLAADFVAHGHGFVDPFKALNHVHAASVGHPPLYVIALAGVVKVFGAHETAMRLAGSAFGAVTIACLGLIGRRIAGERAGLLAAGIGATYPMLFTTDGALMSETLYVALFAAALLAALRLVEERTVVRALIFGALVGLAALTRGDALLLIPLCLFPVVRQPRGWRAAAIACVSLAVVLTPWTVRNESVFHQFLPISSDTTVAGANCHSTYYGKNTGGWDLACIKPYRGNEAEQVSRAEHDSIVYATHHIARLPVVAAARFQRTFLSKPNDVSNLEGRAVRYVNAGYAMYYVLLALSVYGFVLLRRRKVPTWIVVSPIVLVLITTILVYGGVRFRAPAELSFVLLGAVAVDALWERLSQRRAQRATHAPAPLDLAAHTGD